MQTLLAAFDSIDARGRRCRDIIAAGMLPAAMEMMDQLSIAGAEAAVHRELSGLRGAAAGGAGRPGGGSRRADGAGATDLCEKNGAWEIRLAQTEAERALVWKGRKAAFAAMGRISPNYIVQDGVIPRTALPEVLERDRAGWRLRLELRVANVFHAGDGNLHPLVLYDRRFRGRRRLRWTCPTAFSICASTMAARSRASTAWAKRSSK